MNRVFKTNEFIKIKPRVQAETDRVVFILPAPGQPKVNKITNILQKINPVTDTLAEKADLFEFFDIEPEEVE